MPKKRPSPQPKREPGAVTDADHKSPKDSSTELTDAQLDKIAGAPGGNPWAPRVS
jgi:hypothetical protein